MALRKKSSEQLNNVNKDEVLSDDFLQDPLAGEEGLGKAVPRSAGSSRSSSVNLSDDAKRRIAYPDNDFENLDIDAKDAGTVARKSREESSKFTNKFGRKRKVLEDFKSIDDTRILRPGKINKMDLDDIDEEDVISTYIPQRRLRLFGLALLRLDKLRLFLLACLLIVAMVFILSFMQEQMGNFTINLDRLELYRKGISIDDDPNFVQPTARLAAAPIADATNISINDLPSNLDDVSGDHNGENYVAYTYYIRNAGKEDVAYSASITLDDCSKGAEEAVRVAVWHNGEYTLYAAPSEDGSPEENCTSFKGGSLVCSYLEENFLVGNVDKYTIVIWMEGDDPECVDRIVGGSVEFSMNIKAEDDDESSLLVKYVRDIIDTIRGTDPINAAGTEAPEFTYNNVTYDTRRNQ